MKKNDWILAIAVAIYSFLFYKQSAGINFTIFNLFLILILLVKDKSLLRNKLWLIAAIGCILSSICIGYYGNTLSLLANLSSLALLSAYSMNDKSSVIASIVFSIYSYFSAVIFIVLDWKDRKLKNIELQRDSKMRRFLTIGVPALITCLFFFMYKESNALFNDFTKNINLDFISWSWIAFTLGGFVLMYGFFNHNRIKGLAELDENSSSEISSNQPEEVLLFGKAISIKDEEFSGLILFSLLNILLLIVNLLDLNYLIIDRTLPEGLTYSQFVHQGTAMLITSVLIAILIILIYFRGALNFSKNKKWIRLLAYIWVAQNAFMLFSTAFRNDLYITQYGMTYKRIGVYVYLLITLIGLASTFYKIFKIKSNSYLFKVNGWQLYLILIISCFFNWDNIISRFNIENVSNYEKSYLLSLSSANLPLLIQQIGRGASSGEHTGSTKNQTGASQISTTNINSPESFDFEGALSRNLYSFLNQRENVSWKSLHYQETEIYKTLLKNNYKESFTKVNLKGMNINSLKPLSELKNVTELILDSNQFQTIDDLLLFPSATRLSIKDNDLHSLRGIERMTNLEYLDLSQNRIQNYIPLHEMKSLKEIHVDSTISSFQYNWLQKKLPNARIYKS